MGQNQNLGIALIYFRVSTHNQFKKISPEFQKQECINLAIGEGFELDKIRDVYCDEESAFAGSKNKRIGFQEMTRRWKEDPRVKAIVIYDLSRLFRDVRAYMNYRHELELKGIELVSVLEPSIRDTSPGGKLPATIIAAVNQYNSELYGSKIRENMRFKAESGVYPGKAPFGYKNVREDLGSDKDRRWIETNELESPWVQKAFVLYGTGDFSIRSLADKLAEDGFPTRGGRILQPSVIEKLLKDRIYIGWIEWGQVKNPNGQHEKLIPVDLFGRVQLILSAHNREANRKRKFTFLLRGLAWCICKSRMQAGYATGKTGKKYAHYFCRKRQHNRPIVCNQPYVSVDNLEKQFSKLFKKIELTPRAKEKLRLKIQKNFGDKQRIYENTRRGLLLSIDNSKSDQKKAFLEFAKGNVGADVYHPARAELEAEEGELNRRLSNLEGDMKHILRALEISAELTQDIYSAFLRASNPVRSILAQAFFKKIVVGDKKILSVELNPTFDFVCYKKLKNTKVFNLAYQGGSVGSRTPVWKMI